MQAMRVPFVMLIVCAALLGGCSTTGGKGTIGKDFAFPSTNDAIKEFANRPVVRRQQRSLPEGVAPMPFGIHPFGPWEVQGRGLAATMDASKLPMSVADNADYGQERDGNRWLSEPDFNALFGEMHVVLHYIALHSGLQVVIEGTIGEAQCTLKPKPALPLQMIWSLCKRMGCDMMVEGNFVFVAARPPVDFTRVRPTPNDQYHGGFDGQSAMFAIMESAKVSDTQVFIPQELNTDHPIRFQFTNCKPDTILRKIAEQAGLNVEVKDGAYTFSRP